MTNPHRTLAAIIGVAEQLSANLGAHMGVELALAPDVLRAASYDTTGSRSSDPPDPTGTIATTLTPRTARTSTSSWPEFCADAEAALRVLRRMQARQAACIRHDPAVASAADALARNLRCDGTVDPLCTNNAVRAGKCWKCIKRLQRSDAPGDDRGQFPTERARTGNVQPSAFMATAVVVHHVEATCGRCGATFTGPDRATVDRLLAEHHSAGCAREWRDG